MWTGWVAALLAVTAAWQWTTVTHLGSRALGSGLLDPGLFLWWLNWTPWALGHGVNPLHSTYLIAPDGISAMWNTSVLVPGLLLAPVTAVWGPVVSFNLLVVLGPPLTAWTTGLWLARHVRPVPAMIGGLVFGFSPFVMAHERAGHLNFTCLFLLPVIVMLFEDVCWRAPPERVRTRGLLFGLTVSAQLFLGSEALVLTAGACLLLLLFLLARFPGVVAVRWRIALAGLAWGAGLIAVLCAYPLYEQFRPGVAITSPIRNVGGLTGPVSLYVHAQRGNYFFSAAALPPGALNAVEDGMFIGWPLLVLAGLTVVVLHRRLGVLVAGAAVVVSAVTLRGRALSTVELLQRHHFPLLEQVVVARVAIVLWGALAFLVAVAADAALTWVRDPRPRPRWVSAVAPLVIPVVVVGALVPLLPADPVPPSPVIEIPSYFTDGTVREIPAGATVMVAPMALVGDDAAQLWQVYADMRFRQLGGYAERAGAGGKPVEGPSQQALITLFGITLANQQPYRKKPTAALLTRARTELAAARAQFFLLGPSHYGTDVQRTLAVALLGRHPDRSTGGVDVWDLNRGCGTDPVRGPVCPGTP